MLRVPARLPALLALALLVAPATAGAQTAAELFAAGADAHDRGALDEARAKYAASFALHQAPETAANLGVVEGRLGRHRDAAEHLAFALARYRDQGDETKRRRMAEELSRVLGYVGELRVDAPPGARIAVDAAPVGTAPLTLPVYVEPGRHRVEATLADGTRRGVEVEVEAGEAREVAVGARKADASVAGPLAPRVDLAPPRAPEPPGADLDPVLVVGGAGLAVVGVVLGGTFAAMSEGDDGLQKASIASFVVGGAAAVGTLAYVIVVGAADGPAAGAAPPAAPRSAARELRAPPALPRVHVAPVASPQGGGLAAWGRF